MAGLACGLVLAAYVYVVVEPVIDDAVALEEQLAATAEADHAEGEEAAGHTHGEEEPLFTRDEQVVGGAAASVIYAVVMAAVFGTVLAAVRHRLPGRSDLVRTVWLATVTFAAVVAGPVGQVPRQPTRRRRSPTPSGSAPSSTSPPW